MLRVVQTASGNDVRLWFSGGRGRLEEFPNWGLKSADFFTLEGLDTYYDCILETVGAPQDKTVEMLGKLALGQCSRYQMASVKFFAERKLSETFGGRRYCKGNMVLTQQNSWSTLWGYNPLEVLIEAGQLENGVGDGWVPDDIFVDPSTLLEGSDRSIITNTYILNEKPVVDFQAAVEVAKSEMVSWLEEARHELVNQYRMRQPVLLILGAAIGITIGHYLK